mgnify:CR=1 FL=1
MSYKVLITDGLEQIGKDIINAAGEAIDKKGIEADQLLAEVHEYHGMIVRGRTKVTRAVFEAAKNLKVVGRAGVGVDNIDLEAAKEHGVTVVNCPVATTVAVAELAFGMLLSMVRRIPYGDAGMKNEKWLKKELMGSELMGKTLGIIGYGNIGRRLAQYAQAFGMKVICYNRRRDLDEVRSTGAEPVELEDIYTQSDIISLHLPLNADSKHMINDETFAKMKDGIMIVDVARGGVMEEAALLRALESGKVAAAALDVFEKEPPVEWDVPKHPNIIAMPHVGGQTQEAQERAAEDIASEVMNVLQGKDLRWKIV